MPRPSDTNPAVIVVLVREIMTRRVVTVMPDTSLADARRLLDAQRIRHLPVVREDRLVGVVSDRDLRSAQATGARAANVGDVMTPRPITVGPRARIEDAARLLVSHKIGGLPVVDGHELVGIITGDDLLRALIAVIETATLERISVALASDDDA
ncbi:MAG TPA: CBS domain-containing protein [Methylomirabilota bacterium]|nr:CBS domain-containing protein [Methylomirabilota bacterium]